MVNDDAIELDNKEDELPSSYSATQIIRIDSTISYSTFFRTFLSKNRPCIVKLDSLQSWESAQEWVSKGVPNFTVLKNLYGSVSVPVANCGEKYYNVQKKCPTPFSEYLDYWRRYIENDYPSDMPCLYLKDWHFMKEFPTNNVYRVPKFFASDWLNEYLTSSANLNDDYRFVYMGPKGSWTPLHADVFTSFSWSINVCGRKRWILFPPGQENYLRDSHGNLIYNASSFNFLDDIFRDKITPYDVIQESGEAIFVPTGWHHQVWNMEDTISINHNWINGCNIDKMWSSMKNNLDDVKKEIKDCQDMEGWEEHCQIMLQATFGMNYNEFSKFLQFIGRKRLESLKHHVAIILYGNWKLGSQHLVFDLRKVNETLINFLSDKDTQTLQFYKKSLESLENLSMEIQMILSNLRNN